MSDGGESEPVGRPSLWQEPNRRSNERLGKSKSAPVVSTFLACGLQPGLVRGFVARNATPCVPNAAALEALAAPEKVSQRCALNSTSTSPAASMIARISASSRAPAIQPVHRSTFSLAASGTAFATTMSAI